MFLDILEDRLEDDFSTEYEDLLKRWNWIIIDDANGVDHIYKYIYLEDLYCFKLVTSYTYHNDKKSKKYDMYFHHYFLRQLKFSWHKTYKDGEFFLFKEQFYIFKSLIDSYDNNFSTNLISTKAVLGISHES